MAPLVLAPNVVQRIIYFLIHNDCLPVDRHAKRVPDLAKYATISRIWQDGIERETFASLRLDFGRLSKATSIVTSQRRRYVRTIKLDVALPKSGPVESPETDEEKLRNNRALQATFEMFMQVMSLWEAKDVQREGIKLYVDTSTPDDAVSGRLDSPSSWKRQEQLERRRVLSLLELTNPGRITDYPPVVAITEYKGNSSEISIHISAVATCVLLSKLPAVKTAFIDWWRCSHFSRVRPSLSAAISQINQPMDELCISDSSLTFGDWLTFTPPSATSMQELDELSISIRNFSQRLKRLELYDILISDELFFPGTLSLGMAPRWDRLVKLNLHYLPVTHAGEWLFLPDPDASSSFEGELNSGGLSLSCGDMPIGESHPKPSIAAPAMQRFYLSVARAALQMPQLRQMKLIAQLENSISWHKCWHKFRYYTTELVAEALWTSSSGFVPDNEVLDCWRKVPKKHLKKELLVEISNDENAVESLGDDESDMEESDEKLGVA
ncbi:uncharacterized protein TRIVIDRAFT_67735 [Trichoderma virens Gv29-8]|uniref:DUF6546 domain-containing protein n=1 Tax=Hypocrea virens (strain Gv29-8 / FGSC 10586) TaxID=413071 RepID=G9MQP0_HYPVG|nr:uncharacterized protein TRIVIDRAFT_67735 [Trichoderma virens Gv29-8]EHK24107.1 hypothetical protein TRIVIDRAFT_67735 [Trichoderma virens Gv29-8]UKZ50420.1 hypothetical protein TrVGV298_004682 [Trichoderma virens]